MAYQIRTPWKFLRGSSHCAGEESPLAGMGWVEKPKYCAWGHYVSNCNDLWFINV